MACFFDSYDDLSDQTTGAGVRCTMAKAPFSALQIFASFDRDKGKGY